ncbi:MAG: hypothetical protein OEZ55_08495, partial [Nitrospinota bacterium]|nr:hypothetical protein [Nitrospinota bacterium]
MIRYKGKLCAVMLCFIALQFTTPGVTEAVADNSKEQGSPCSPLKIMLVDAWRESADISLATAEDGQAGEYKITVKYALGDTIKENNIDSADAQYIDRKGREYFLKIDPDKLAAAEDMILVEFVKNDNSCTKNRQSLSLFTKHTFRFDFGASMELDQKGSFNNKPQLAFSSRSDISPNFMKGYANILAGFDLRYTYYSEGEGGSPAPEAKNPEKDAARLFSSNLAEPAPSDPGPGDAFKQSGGRF